MTRNLKALGLALVAAFALSAVVASAASAEPAKFTASVGAKETAGIHGGQIGTDKFVVGGGPELTCATATLTGKALSVGSASTEVTLTPNYQTCHAIVTIFGVKVTRTATVTVNQCAYVFNATKNTGGFPFSADLTVECKNPGESIEVHVYNTSNSSDAGLTPICTYDIAHQTVNDAIQLTNAGTDVVAHVNATVTLNNTIPNATCTTSTSAVYTGEDTLTATNEAGGSVNSSVS